MPAVHRVITHGRGESGVMRLPEDHLNPNLWQVFIKCLQSQLVLVLQSLVQLMVPVDTPGPHVAGIEPFLGGREGETDGCMWLTHAARIVLNGEEFQ